MKRLRTTFLTAGILAIAALAMVSCSKEESAQAGGLDRTGTISVSVSGLMGEYTQNDDTKAELISNVRVSWKADDKVYAFDGTQCLGELNVSLKDGNDYYALLTGDLLEPASGTTNITLVYASGYSATQGQTVTDGKLSFDISSQSSGSDSKNTPFVAFGTLDYTEGTPNLNEKVVDFTLATSVMRLNCSGFEPSGTISGAKLIGMSNKCVLNVTNAGAELGQGAIGDISLLFADEFKASASGAQVIYAAIAKNGTSSTQSLEIKQSTTYKYSFGTRTRDAAKSFNAICQMALPYVEIAGLKWYRQNLSISHSGNAPYRPDGKNTVRVPGCNEDAIIGDFFQWGAYQGYCGDANDPDKGLLVYSSFPGEIDGGDRYCLYPKLVNNESRKYYWFFPISGQEHIVLPPVFEGHIFFGSTEMLECLGICPYYEETTQSVTKYNSTSTTLELCDDVANIILGGNWHIPTVAEYMALVDVTTWTYDEQDKGIYVTKKGEVLCKDKSNALLFFPVITYMAELKWEIGEMIYPSSRYWTSTSMDVDSSTFDFINSVSVYTFSPSFAADPDPYFEHPISPFWRYYGLPVRPVSD